MIYALLAVALIAYVRFAEWLSHRGASFWRYSYLNFPTQKTRSLTLFRWTRVLFKLGKNKLTVLITPATDINKIRAWGKVVYSESYRFFCNPDLDLNIV